jgi:hypothetical protein
MPIKRLLSNLITPRSKRDASELQTILAEIRHDLRVAVEVLTWLPGCGTSLRCQRDALTARIYILQSLRHKYHQHELRVERLFRSRVVPGPAAQLVVRRLQSHQWRIDEWISSLRMAADQNPESSPST